MINSFLNVNISKKIFTAINPITDTKYTFIKHNKGEDITQNLEKYGISYQIHISPSSNIINDWLNLDDTIQMVLNKIGIYC